MLAWYAQRAKIDIQHATGGGDTGTETTILRTSTILCDCAAVLYQNGWPADAETTALSFSLVLHVFGWDSELLTDLRRTESRVLTGLLCVLAFLGT